MDKNLAGTKTAKNLETAFAGESGARNKYTFFASKAKKDGYPTIAKIFPVCGSIAIKPPSTLASWRK